MERSLYSDSLYSLFSDYTFKQIIESASNRNQTTVLRGDPIVTADSSGTQVTVTLKIMVPNHQEVLYFMNYVQTFKNAVI
jgi:hypothetical protein